MVYSRQRYNNIARWDEIARQPKAVEQRMEVEAKWRKGEWSEWLALEKKLVAELNERKSNPQLASDWYPAIDNCIGTMSVSYGSVWFAPSKEARALLAKNVKKNAIFQLEAMDRLAWETDALRCAEIFLKYQGAPRSRKDLRDYVHYGNQDEQDLKKVQSSNEDLTFYENFVADNKDILLEGDLDELPAVIIDPYAGDFFTALMNIDEPPNEVNTRIITSNVQWLRDEVEARRYYRAKYIAEQEGKTFPPRKDGEPRQPYLGELKRSEVEWTCYDDTGKKLPMGSAETIRELNLAQHYSLIKKTGTDYLTLQLQRDFDKLSDYYPVANAIKSAATDVVRGFLYKQVKKDFGFTAEGCKKGVAWVRSYRKPPATDDMCDALDKIFTVDAKARTFEMLMEDPEWGTAAWEQYGAKEMLRKLLDDHEKAIAGGEDNGLCDPIAELMMTCTEVWDAALGKVAQAEMRLKRLYGRSRHALHTDLDSDTMTCDPKVCLKGEFEYSAK